MIYQCHWYIALIPLYNRIKKVNLLVLASGYKQNRFMLQTILLQNADVVLTSDTPCLQQSISQREFVRQG